MHDPRLPTQLSDAVIRSTMTAMVTIIMGRNESTQARAMDFTMMWKGESLNGVSAAERVFLESLSENVDGWVAYLQDSANRKVATSMDVALSDGLTAELERTAGGLRITEVLRRVLNDIPVFEPMPTGEHKIIDLREEAPVDVP